MNHFMMNMPRLLIFFVGTLLIGFLTSCDENDQFQSVDFSTVPDAPDTTGAERHELDGGVVIYIHQEGDGRFQVGDRDMVLARYTMRTLDERIHDSTWANGNETASDLDMRSVIQGVRLGMNGMTEGGERTLIIPPEYGYAGTGNELANDTLHFHVELEEVLD